MSERLVLALDGSTSICSAALLRAVGQGGSATSWQVVASRAEDNGRGQAKVLLRLVDEMLEQLGGKPSDLGTIVVGTGPGTFTGVRIAVATARGLALALAVPVMGVSSLAALAACVLAEASQDERASWSNVVPVIDARRQQVFFSVYEAPGQGVDCDRSRWTRRRPIEVCDQGSLAATLEASGIAGAAVTGRDRGLVGELSAETSFVVGEVRAEYLVMGQKSLEEGAGPTGPAGDNDQPAEAAEFGEPETVRPIYVRAPDADMHITKMRDPWADGRDKR